ncbi:MAG: hypothetical protein HN872_00750 [Gammaproteobacteria bacterium]|nr:hypothetical protein [Gammaproteobacteria bacterium]MBT7225115.1 hypothetical protein [Gammaproteobacteria bacterium]
MNWEAIGAIGEVLGAVAVFISLSYLALQIKSNTASMEVTSRQSVANEYRDWIRAFHSAEPEHFTRGMSDYPNMPFRARTEFAVSCHDLVLFYQSAQAMHEAGTLPDANHEPYRVWVAAVLCTPGGRNFWAKWKPSYNGGRRTA